jgi:hypothetical protein
MNKKKYFKNLERIVLAVHKLSHCALAERLEMNLRVRLEQSFVEVIIS